MYTYQLRMSMKFSSQEQSWVLNGRTLQKSWSKINRIRADVRRSNSQKLMLIYILDSIFCDFRALITLISNSTEEPFARDIL